MLVSNIIILYKTIEKDILYIIIRYTVSDDNINILCTYKKVHYYIMKTSGMVTVDFRDGWI